MPRYLAGSYLAAVGTVWLGHIVGLLLLLVTGRTSWTTQNTWVVILGFVLIATVVVIVWLVDRCLHRDAPRMTEALRMLGLAYGSAVHLAWRRLRR